MNPSSRTFVPVAMPAVLAVPVWATAAGAVVSCGQAITQSTVLDNDWPGAPTTAS